MFSRDESKVATNQHVLLREDLLRLAHTDERVRIEGFLREHNEIADLVSDALTRLPRYFPASGYRLELMSDPDSEAPKDDLICFIQTDQDLDTAEAAYDAFRDDWWLDNLLRAGGRLTLVIEYL